MKIASMLLEDIRVGRRKKSTCPPFASECEHSSILGHADAPYSHSILGELISNIRSGHNRIPPHFEEELLVDMGLDLCEPNMHHGQKAENEACLWNNTKWQHHSSISMIFKMAMKDSFTETHSATVERVKQ